MQLQQQEPSVKRATDPRAVYRNGDRRQNIQGLGYSSQPAYVTAQFPPNFQEEVRIRGRRQAHRDGVYEQHLVLRGKALQNVVL